MDDDDHVEPPQRAELRQSDAGSAEEAFQDYLRHLDRMPPPYDDATRFIRQRDIERHREWLARAFRPQIPRQAPPFRPSRLKRYTALLHTKAIALLDRGSIVIETNGDELRAEIHRFPDGSAVLETECGGSAGMRPLQADDFDSERFAVYLESALFNARVRPIADQEI
jgi:hypothetical protein